MGKTRKSVRMVLVFGGLMCSREACADSFDLTPEQLFSATVMSASKTSEKLMNAPAAIYVLTNEDIRRSGATSIPEALRMVPGMEVAQGNANSWAISVRGFNSGLANKLLVLIDGREVYDPLFSGVYWDVQDLPLQDIDRIEVIRGPGASLWGANAVNGVINILTKKAGDTQGGMVDAIAGNQDRAITTGRYGGKFSDDGYWRVYGKYLKRTDELTVDDHNPHDAWQEGRGGFRTDWKSDSRNSYTVQGDFYRSNAGQMRFASYFDAPFTRLQSEDILATGGNVLGRWTRNLSADSSFTVQSYVDYTSRNQLLIENQRSSFDLDAQYELPYAARQKWIVGARYRFSADSLNQTTPAVTFNRDTRHDQTFSIFAQDKITLQPERWFLTLGSKFENNDYTGIEVQPTARLQWHPDSKQMMWAAVSRAVRTPSRLERDLDIAQVTFAGPDSLNTIGSNDFESEDLLAYELGYRRQITPKMSLDTALFYNDYRHLSTLVFEGVLAGSNPPHGVVAYHYTNDTTGETYGIEPSLNWRVADDFNLSGSYTLLAMALHGPAGALGAETPEKQSPRHQFSLRSQWDVTEGLQLDTSLYHVSGLSNFQVDPYLRLDTRLNWKIMDNVELTAVGQNLLDPHHAEFTAPDDIHTLQVEVGRSFYGEVTWHF